MFSKSPFRNDTFKKLELSSSSSCSFLQVMVIDTFRDTSGCPQGPYDILRRNKCQKKSEVGKSVCLLPRRPISCASGRANRQLPRDSSSEHEARPHLHRSTSQVPRPRKQDTHLLAHGNVTKRTNYRPPKQCIPQQVVPSHPGSSQKPSGRPHVVPDVVP